MPSLWGRYVIEGMLSSALLNTISWSSVTKLFGFTDVGMDVVKSSLSGQYLQNIQNFLKFGHYLSREMDI